jgi:hypothetical protein
MAVMRHTRRNDPCQDGSPSGTRPDLFGLSMFSPAANEVQGLLIIDSVSTLRDESGRTNDFTSGYFTCEGDSLSS